MRPSTLAVFAAAVFGWASAATAAPIVSLPQAAFEAHRNLELVRRHHRGRSRGHWGYERFGRDLSGDDSGLLAGTIGRGGPEAARPDRRRQGGWVDPPRGF